MVLGGSKTVSGDFVAVHGKTHGVDPQLGPGKTHGMGLEKPKRGSL